MKLFRWFRPILRIALALEQIVHALNYFATEHAREHGRLYRPGGAKRSFGDNSELLHTDRPTIEKLKQEDDDFMVQHGMAALEEIEANEE